MNNPEAQRRGQMLAMTAKTSFVIASEAKQSRFLKTFAIGFTFSTTC